MNGSDPASIHVTAADSEARRRGRPRRVLRAFEHGLAAFGLAVLICWTTPLPIWLHNAMDRQDKLQPAKYILCLGGDNGRVIEAVRLLKDGYGEKLVVSNHGFEARRMRDMAYDWGAPYDKILVDDESRRTADHPASIIKNCGVDPAADSCIVVTNYLHMARCKACFEKAGFKRLIMRQPRWERSGYSDVYRTGFYILPRLLYECAAWVEYKLKGFV